MSAKRSLQLISPQSNLGNPMKGQHGVMFLKLQIKSFLKAYIVQKSLLL
jgi:hypothetical protein